MARALHKLSSRFIATAVDPGRYSDGGNLYLSIGQNGGRRWVFMFRHRGRVREKGLGSARDVTLARARELAAAARALLAEGRNPLDDRPIQKPQIPTFSEAAARHVESMVEGWRGRTASGWRWTLAEYAKQISDVPVDEITTEHVLGVLRPIWGSKPETASRVRSRIEAILDGCKVRGQRSGENPAAWRGNLAHLLPAPRKLSRGHHPAMPYQDLPALITRLRASPTTSHLALELLIRTAARSGEIMGARWREFDLITKLWTVPARRMKGGVEHRVPLTDRAMEILAEVAADERAPEELVFKGARPGRPTLDSRLGEKPLSTMALAMALRRAGGKGFTPHGMRSAFRDWSGDLTTYPRELAEQALAHAIRDATERAYRRGDALEKRRQMMLTWDKFLDGAAP